LLLDARHYVPVKKAVEEALALLPREPRIESVSARRAYGRVAALDVACRMDIPSLSSSHMDGYALRAEETCRASTEGAANFVVAGEVPAGQRPKRRLGNGEAMRVSTGSFLPVEANAVVPVEEAEVAGGRVSVKRAFPAGSHVYLVGQDFRKGSIVLKKGDSIRAQDVGLLIAIGVDRLKVYSRPRVAVLATGNEITNSIKASGGKVRNSHVPILLSLARELGCGVIDLGIAPDSLSAILGKLRKGLRSADLVLTIGGTSMGRLDLADGVVRKLNPQLLHHGIRMDRGRVAGLAIVSGRAVIMLPGPVQGAINAFVLLGLPVIQRLSGGRELVVRTKVRLSARWKARSKFADFAKVVYLRISGTGAAIEAEPIVGETESMSVLSGANAFLLVPEEVKTIEAGEEVDALLLPGFSFAH